MALATSFEHVNGKMKMTITFDDPSDVENILSSIKPTFNYQVAKGIALNYSLGRLKEWIRIAKKLDFVIPFDFYHVFDLIALYREHQESTVPNSLEKATILYEYLCHVKEKGGLSALQRLTTLPRINRFSASEDRIELSMKLLDLFEPSEESWRYVFKMDYRPIRDNALTDRINEYLDKKRSRESIIYPVRHAGRDLQTAESDSESEDTRSPVVKKGPAFPKHEGKSGDSEDEKTGFVKKAHHKTYPRNGDDETPRFRDRRDKNSYPRSVSPRRHNPHNPKGGYYSNGNVKAKTMAPEKKQPEDGREVSPERIREVPKRRVVNEIDV